MLNTWDYKFQTLKLKGDYSHFNNALLGSDHQTKELLDLFFDPITGDYLHSWNNETPNEDIEKKDYDKVALIIYLA